MNNLIDQQLINKCLNQDRKAQKALYDRYSAYGMSIIYRYLPADQVDDVFLKSFQKVFTKLSTFDQDKGLFKNWFAKIVSNESLNHLKSLKKFDYDEITDFSEFVVEEQSISNLNVDDIYKAISDLKEPYRTILNMVLDGYTYKEISEYTNVTAVTCRSYYMRSKKMLIRLLEHQEKISLYE